MDQESILTSVKQLIGIDPSFDCFDTNIILHINSVFMILRQLGAGPSFSITGVNEKWSDYIPNISDLAAIKTYVALKVKSMFDPAQSTSVNEAIQRTISELEWRINVAVDPKEGNVL